MAQIQRIVLSVACYIAAVATPLVQAQRIPVLPQIDLPHNYYFRELYVPQLTTGPSSVAWSPDGKKVVYSMQGSLWIQAIDEPTAVQVTNGAGYDYQPDWSWTKNQIAFVRYNGASAEIMQLNPSTHEVVALTANGAVNLEPRWSPDGKRLAFVSTHASGHFLLHVATVTGHQLSELTCLTPDRKSAAKRYYYSAFDHAINPAWSPDGTALYFLSNEEVIHGTGHLIKINVESRERTTLLSEETNWQMRPDPSPDGTRLVYASYVGQNRNQLWLIPSTGGQPFPITYGEFDNLAPRWSPDGTHIAFISNRSGNTSLWTVNAWDGKQRQINPVHLRFIEPHQKLRLEVADEKGLSLPVRIHIYDSQGKSYAPSDVWIQSDDSRYPTHSPLEAGYFHANGSATLDVPAKELWLQVHHGPAYAVAKRKLSASDVQSGAIRIVMQPMPVPATWGEWQSGDLHVHMNYGGHYVNTPAALAEKAEAEDLDYVFNLIVNKEQRIPDINYFTPVPFKTARTLISHGQEFHTSFWGHLGLLALNDHLILPDYASYPGTAAQSVFPHNSFVADRAHEQDALVGYVHPFEKSEVFPEQAPTLYNELPVDAAVGKVDYYELVGFSDHKASEAVWYQLLNAGIRLPAGAGTDAMANYASLRGPVGLNRVYVQQTEQDHHQFLSSVRAGKSFVTNGPLVGLEVNSLKAGDSLQLNGSQTIAYKAFLSSQIPIDHLEVIYNGEVVATHTLTGDRTQATVSGRLKATESGWILLRAWNDQGHPDLYDLYAYASTNPIYVKAKKSNSRKAVAGKYFETWCQRIATKLPALSVRTELERKAIEADLRTALDYYRRIQK